MPANFIQLWVKKKLKTLSFSGHVECSFDKTARNFSPKASKTFTQSSTKILNYSSEKFHFFFQEVLDTSNAILTTLPKFFLDLFEYKVGFEKKTIFFSKSVKLAVFL